MMDRMFTGKVARLPVPWELHLPWLDGAATAVGIGCLLAGGLLLLGPYRGGGPRGGIPIAPPWFRAFCDLVAIAFGLFLVTFSLDALWMGVLGQPSLLGLDPLRPDGAALDGLHFVSVLGLFGALPPLTLWLTGLAGQRVEVDTERITSHGARGTTSLAWTDLERVRLREQRNPFAFTVVDFRPLQTVLDLEGAGQTLTINEPRSRACKAAVTAALRRHAPEDRAGLLEVLRDW